MTNPTKPRIYVACLAAYNAGYLHGVWIDATQESYIMYAMVSQMLEESPISGAEEWAVHDYEGFGTLTRPDYPLHGWSVFENAHALACFITEHNDLGIAVLEHFNGDLKQAKAALTNYVGTYNNLADFTKTHRAETDMFSVNAKNGQVYVFKKN